MSELNRKKHDSQHKTTNCPRTTPLAFFGGGNFPVEHCFACWGFAKLPEGISKLLDILDALPFGRLPGAGECVKFD